MGQGVERREAAAMALAAEAGATAVIESWSH